MPTAASAEAFGAGRRRVSILYWRCSTRATCFCASGSHVSILYWRCRIREIAEWAVDASVSILYWRCSGLADAPVAYISSFVFQFSIGDALLRQLLKRVLRNLQRFNSLLEMLRSSVRNAYRRDGSEFQFSIGDALPLPTNCPTLWQW